MIISVGILLTPAKAGVVVEESALRPTRLILVIAYPYGFPVLTVCIFPIMLIPPITGTIPYGYYGGVGFGGLLRPEAILTEADIEVA